MNGTFPNICGDALALPLRDQSFDVVSSTLFAHHLEPEELVKFTNEALRVARHAVLINDLVRSSIHYGLTIAGRAIYRSRVTRHDAPVSVRRSYTVSEMRDIVAQSCAAKIDIRTSFLFRMGVIAWKQA
jgi:ubiquinone/menaquinone biosynthesis C-methylase UbiE